MNYHLILTRRCNLNCCYCHGGEESGPDTEIQYSFDELAAFLEKDDDVQLMLYGGEPTLRISLLCQLMDRFPDARFMLQTNALLLDRIPPEYMRRFHSVLVSIDGRELVTDGYRSKGVYKRVLGNVRWLRKIGYSGDIVARMAVSQDSDIYKDVNHLINLKNPAFDHVHWQLNVVWDAENNWTDFDTWIKDSYNPGISRLVAEWVDKMKEGKIEGIVPFMPLVYSIITGDSSKLRCGSGIDTFAIHVDGKIGICPISPDWDFTIVGNIRETNPVELKEIMHVDEPCPSCDEYGICGGRCFFANKEKLWGEEGFAKVCTTVKHLISTLREHIPTITSLIEAGQISLEEFRYPEYNNGCEIIP
ncbi:MAG: TIGR04084 family radical SAM/SPASM domain-containing protein [Candidatus Thorarchaeota archaeon]